MVRRRRRRHFNSHASGYRADVDVATLVSKTCRLATTVTGLVKLRTTTSFSNFQSSAISAHNNSNTRRPAISMADLIVAPIHGDFFVGRGWRGLKVDVIARRIESQACGINVRTLPLISVLNKHDLLPEGAFLFYSSSYDDKYRLYLRDAIQHLHKCRPDVTLIPNVELLCCHENKGYQELYKKRLGINDLDAAYVGDASDLIGTDQERYPMVVKMLGGSGSSTVSLAHNRNELLKILERNSPSFPLLATLKWPFVRVLKGRSAAANYRTFHRRRLPFVAQRFLTGLTHDYRVLMFGDKLYPLKRLVRPKDFRASGSGLHLHERPSDQLLDYAYQLKEAFDTPFLSMDIAEDEKGLYLLEFQAIGFGYRGALENSQGYYRRVSHGVEHEWSYIEAESTLETDYADALASYIASKVK